MNNHPTLESTKLYWRYPDLQRVTGLSQSFWRHGVSAGRIPHIKLGKTVLFDAEEIRAFIEAGRVQVTGGKQ